MIFCFTGKAGTGKSLHLARECMDFLRIGKTVICNFPVNSKVIDNENESVFNKLFKIKINVGNFIYRNSYEINVKELVQYAFNNHKPQKEEQTLLAIDESQILFNAREFYRADRKDWINFLMEHRKIGYKVIIVAQNLRIIDKQIRSLILYEIRHKKVNEYKFFKLSPKETFMAVWFNMDFKERMRYEFFTYCSVYGQFFDSYKLLGDLI
jgi:hypothetical protein